MTSAMSSPTNEYSDKLRRAYTAVLIQILYGLNENEQDNLRFYFSRLIPTEVKGFLNILRSLEYVDEISWVNVNSLKEALLVIKRLDLAKLLTTFEIRRDLTILLELYARKRVELDFPYVPASIKNVACQLLTVVKENDNERFVATRIRKMVESNTNIQQVFEDEVDVRSGLKSPWSKLIMLVIIAGEIIVAAQASRSDEIRRNEMLEQCFSLVDKLSSRILELGGWDAFCAHVANRSSEAGVYQEETNYSNTVVTEVVKQLKTSTLFSLDA